MVSDLALLTSISYPTCRRIQIVQQSIKFDTVKPGFKTRPQSKKERMEDFRVEWCSWQFSSHLKLTSLIFIDGGQTGESMERSVAQLWKEVLKDERKEVCKEAREERTEN